MTGRPALLTHRIRRRVHRSVVQRRYRTKVAAGASAPQAMFLMPLLGHFELPPPPDGLAPTAARYMEGWFDLLGSGWRPFSAPSASSSAVIDWHADLLSGHRWDPSQWHRDVDTTPGPGIDVKLPWELGRLQHLPQLALAFRHSATGAPGFAEPELYRRTVEEHLADFIRRNPPGRGVQWGCAMDVGIRVANMLLALDILASGEATLSAAVRPLVTASVHAHAAFIVANLEWTPTRRTNHYLADICGLLWAAAHLEGSQQSDSWLCLAARELQAETRVQFDRDGAGTEGSTSYHRLSAEMVVWSTALLLALPDERVRSLQLRRRDLRDAPLDLQSRPASPDDVAVGRNHLRLVARMPALTRAVSWDGSHVVLLGDNDSGRFVKPAPALHALPVREVVASYRNLEGYAALPPDETYWWEDQTDHRHLISAVDGLFGHADGGADGTLVGAYVRRPVARPSAATSLTVGVGAARSTVDGSEARWETHILPGGEDLLAGLETHAFVSFGLYVWRSHRLFLSIRCGPVGQGGLGGHDHRDQLAIELVIDGVPWFRDPGSFTYTRDPDLRNAYRSAAAHAGPGDMSPEDWLLAPGLFELGELAMIGVPLWYGRSGFVGERQAMDGVARRSIALRPDGLEIIDVVPGTAGGRTELRSADDAARLVARPVPIAPGYGWQERPGKQDDPLYRKEDHAG